MKGLSKIDDSIGIKKGCYFNYYRRLKKTKVVIKSDNFDIHLNRTRRASLMPGLVGFAIPVCVYGIYTNACLFDLKKISKDDQFKLLKFYPELADQLDCYKELKRKR